MTTAPERPMKTGASASTPALLRLAAAGGRSDRLRIGLTALGSAAATVTLLTGAAVAFISDTDGPYRLDILDQPGLRPGVIVALALLCLPILMFVGVCTRVGAPARDRRLAALRMAGATPGETTRIAVFETGLAALVGTVLGTCVFMIGRTLLDSTSPGEFTVRMADGSTRGGGGLVRALPTDVHIPVLGVLGVVALITFGSMAASAVALRKVRLSPFGVTRTVSPEAPTKTAAALFVVGAVVLSLVGIVFRFVDWELAFLVASLVALIGFVTCVAGLVMGSASITSAVGHALAPRVSRPDLLIASRRMIAAPYTSSRATASVVLAVLIGGAVQGTRANFLAGTDPSDTFYTDTFRLIDGVLIVAIVLAAANLLVTAAEAIVERRRSLAMLAANGTPRGVIARAIMFESMVPLVPSVLLAGGAGVLGSLSLWGWNVSRPASWEVDSGPQIVSVRVPIPWERLAVLCGGTIAVSLAVTAVSLLFLERSTRPAEFRAAA